jgi:hypothetical protein
MPALGAHVHSDVFCNALCGAEETRTPDFLLAKEALYQLSYGPVSGCAANGAAAPSIASLASDRVVQTRPIRRSRIQA